jgi:hypothetical protein
VTNASAHAKAVTIIIADSSSDDANPNPNTASNTKTYATQTMTFSFPHVPTAYINRLPNHRNITAPCTSIPTHHLPDVRPSTSSDPSDLPSTTPHDDYDYDYEDD